MTSGWRYRLASVIGTASITAIVVPVTSHPTVEDLAMSLPVVSHLPKPVHTHGGLTIITVTTVLAVLLSLIPLYKPRPRRIIDVISETQRRILLAALALATIGYFDYTYRLPRMMLVLTTLGLLVLLPAWHVLIRNQKRNATESVIIIGNDVETITTLHEKADIPFIGYVSLNQPISSPSESSDRNHSSTAMAPFTDGGAVIASHADVEGLEYLGGISRLNEIIVENDPDTVVLAFSQADREEFFGVLRTCYQHGVTAKVHRDLGNDVLTCDTKSDMLRDINLEPWDWQDRMVKRAFDALFAAVGLLVASPLVLGIAIAIKLDSPGSVIYAQERTATFGGTFTIYKFRSMVENAEQATGAVISEEDAGEVDPRVTRVGRILRQTHLDEIPQLWSIFTGHMSVVGPRPERPEIDREITADVTEWKQRWFVKPGLTGPAQINDVTGHEPDRKLRYDVKYIRNQSVLLDVRIIIKQVYKVAKEATDHLK
ncbi:sugar transferase [Halocatena salina]|uniref:sugar transferase n=1 Tax=Halocatena salina TaxID=2934340 RepID=UPI0034A29682